MLNNSDLLRKNHTGSCVVLETASLMLPSIDSISETVQAALQFRADPDGFEKFANPDDEMKMKRFRLSRSKANYE